MESETSDIEVLEKTVFRTPRDAFRFFAGLLGDRAVEHVVVAYLDDDLRVLRVERVADGDPSAAMLPVAAMLHGALRHGASGLMLAHNHPSGDPKPSLADKTATRRLATAASALEIALVDHVVVARGGGTFSFRLSGLL